MTTLSFRTARRVLLALLPALIFGSGVQAQDDGNNSIGQGSNIVYTTAVPFLMIEPDSRAAGMGNAGVGLADNASAVFWNPAGLARQRGAEVSITHSNWLPAITSDLFYEYLAGKYHLEGIGTFGGNITFFNLGEQEFRGPNNEDLGTFRSYELNTGLSYARQVTRGLALGTGLRLIYSNLAGGVTLGQGQPGETQTKAGVSVGLDLAALYTFKPFELGSIPVTTNLGFNLANMGPKVKYTTNECNERTGESCGDPLPTNLRFGGAFSAQLDEFNKLNLAIDFNKTLVDYEQFQVLDENDEPVFDENGNPELAARAKPFYEAIFSSWKSVPVRDTNGDIEDVGVLRQITVGTGLEYWYNDLVAFRTGFFYEDPSNGNRKFLTFGAGIRYNLIGVDFSYIYPIEEESPLANTLRFSLLLNVLR
ncbi:MAG: type IX secretion system outer membrane channel protein PorV [Bacteroidota bacterium]